MMATTKSLCVSTLPKSKAFASSGHIGQCYFWYVAFAIVFLTDKLTD